MRTDNHHFLYLEAAEYFYSFRCRALLLGLNFLDIAGLGEEKLLEHLDRHRKYPVFHFHGEHPNQQQQFEFQGFLSWQLK